MIEAGGAQGDNALWASYDKVAEGARSTDSRIIVAAGAPTDGLKTRPPSQIS